MSIPNSEHQQYFTISALSSRLNKELVGAILHDAYTLSKEELVLVFAKTPTAFFTIKIVQQFQTCFMWFNEYKPDKISNAQVCFQSVIGSAVLHINQHQDNRSFELEFKQDTSLVFKCYDSLVNVLLFENQVVTDVFRKNILNDWELNPTSFGLVEPNTDDKEKWFYIYKRNHLQHPYYFVTHVCDDELVAKSTNVLEMLSVFSGTAIASYKFSTQKNQLLSSKQALLKRNTITLNTTEDALKQKQNGISNEEIANIIMANLHELKTPLKQVELFDFYRNNSIVIKLKSDLNAQQNAAYYYRKHKNSKQEIDQLEQKIASARKTILKLDQEILTLLNIQSYKELKSFLPNAKSEKSKTFAFKLFTHEGFDIWVGKNASNNDELTVRHSHKNDLWLHAKDVSGSHVLVKWKPGKDFPLSVITKAAQIAAYYSKLKGSNLVPVSYTLKKYVRKPKGFEPGQVVVDKEEVLLVEPIL